MDGFSRDWNAPAGAAKDGDSGQRRRRRDSMMLTAQIRIGDDPEIADVRIRNLSADGLMAEFALRVPVETPIWLYLRGVGRVTGKVAWCAEGRLGIALDDSIDPRLARKPTGSVTARPVQAKPPSGR